MLVLWGWMRSRNRAPGAEIITESGDFIITESGLYITTE